MEQAPMTRHFGWNAFAFGFGPRGFWGGPRGGGRRRQWFESGDMKYVILKLLKDKPRHGYEVMKELEERHHGCYSPSPGNVYPTLQWQVDEGLGGGMGDLNRAMGGLMRSAYRTGWRSRDDTVRRKISDILKKAAQEI